LYKLQIGNGELESGKMKRVVGESIDFEKDFENWLENSPSVLLDDDDKNTVMWIGRQVNATVGDIGKYPDLLGIDADGDLVIVELKKGRTPREVIAQILEYASWGAALSYDDLNQIAMQYFADSDTGPDCTLKQVYLEIFYPDAEDSPDIHFNVKQKLYIIAEEFSQTVRQVAAYLRNSFNMDIHCLQYQVYKTQEGDYLISTERVVGYGQKASGITAGSLTAGQRWNEPISIRDLTFEAVKKIINGDNSVVFSPIQVISEILKTHPGVNRSSLRCHQLIADCVNHTSRKHYQGSHDLYYLVEKGKYRIYNPEKDGKWNDKGEKL